MMMQRWRPTARIEINGQDKTSEFLGGESPPLVSLAVTDEAGVRSDLVELVLDNRGSIAAPPIGAEVKVYLGFEPQPVYMGRFRIDEWSKSMPTRILRVTAKAADLTTAIRAPRMRSHHETTLGEIVERIGAEHGLGVAIDGKLAARPIAHADQQTESDLHFLTRLARAHGAVFKLADGKVLFVAAGALRLASGNPKERQIIRPADVTEWSVTVNGRGDFKAVRCGYIEEGTRQRRFATVGSGEPIYRDRRLYGSEGEARAAAEAQLGRFRRGATAVEFTGPGMPDLFAEALIRLEGFDPDCDGDYLAKSVRHIFDDKGFVTQASLEGGGASDDEAPEE